MGLAGVGISKHRLNLGMAQNSGQPHQVDAYLGCLRVGMPKPSASHDRKTLHS
jgi:hypothetical protein